MILSFAAVVAVEVAFVFVGAGDSCQCYSDERMMKDGLLHYYSRSPSCCFDATIPLRLEGLGVADLAGHCLCNYPPVVAVVAVAIVAFAVVVEYYHYYYYYY